MKTEAEAREQLAAHIKDFQARFKTVELAPPRAFAPDGKPHDSVTTYRISHAGSMIHDIGPPAKSPWDAVERWWANLETYAKGRTGDTLWWRTEPELERSNGRWTVYCRLHIGGKGA